nr:CD276 antigen homolog [Misgurnus anguillicaudatus]
MNQKTHLQTCTDTFTIQSDEQKFVSLKMDLNVFVFVSAILTISEGFTVKGSSDPLVVPLGGSVVLPCSVDSLLPLKDLEVEWRRSDTQTLIHLYQDEDIRPESQHQDYHDRANFFTEDIKHGNFSLLLNNLTAEDEGQYTCKVYSGQTSGETVVEIKHVERLIVSGSSPSISVYVGDDVTLNCSVNSHIKPEEIEEVSWKKTDKGEPITVLLYQNNETLSGSSDEQYRDRVEFFTDEIHRGNFSLRLKRVTTEDKGVYICQVFAGELSGNTTVILQQLGFSVLHIIVWILCITTCGLTLLFCSLIYCRSNNTEKDDRKQQQKHRVPEIHWRNPEDREMCELQKNLWSLNEARQDPVFRLQMCLVFCPNLIMFFAFIFWGVSEGSVNETICCCALYFLRPLTLLWAAPYINVFKGMM